MKMAREIVLFLILSVYSLSSAYSISASPPSFEDLEEKIIDLEKRILYLEGNLRKLAPTNRDDFISSGADQVEFNDSSNSQSIEDLSDNSNKLNIRDNNFNLSESFDVANPSKTAEEKEIKIANVIGGNEYSKIDDEVFLKIKDYYRKAIKEIRMQNYDKSLFLLDSILKSHVDKNSQEIKEIIANSNYLIGEIYLKKGDYQNASDYMYESYNLFHTMDKSHAQGANSLFQLAKSLRGMNKNEGACNTLKKLKNEFKKLSDNLENKIDIELSQLKCNLSSG